jgi:hypothetical protein
LVEFGVIDVKAVREVGEQLANEQSSSRSLKQAEWK